MAATFQPDYRRLLKTIAHEEPDRVPLADFQADTALKDRFMGRPIRSIADHVAFQAAAGFDFIYLRANYDYPGTSPVVSTGTPRLVALLHRARSKRIGSMMCQRYMPKRCCDLYRPSGRITGASPGTASCR